MFLRELKVRRGGASYTYLKIVESVRLNGKSNQRTLVNLGNVSGWPTEKLQDLRRILTRFLGDDQVALSDVSFSDCRRVGPYIPGSCLWDQLGLDRIITRALGERKIDILVSACARAMVLAQLVAPRSKKAVWEMLEQSALIPTIDPSALPLHAYYRSLEYLSEVKLEIEKGMRASMTHLFNLDVSLVFYDLTSSYFEGTECPLSKKGYSRDHRPDCLQLEIGLLVDQDGIPFGHEVFEGNVQDATTVLCALERLKRDFAVKRCIFVGDDGMASKTNLEAVEQAGYEYITSLSLRKSVVAKELLEAMPKRSTFQKIDHNLYLCPLRTDECVPQAPESGEVVEPGDRPGAQGRAPRRAIRYIASYNPERAAASQRHRRRRLRQCITYLRQLQAPPKLGACKRTPEQLLQAAAQFVAGKACKSLFILDIEDQRSLQWTIDKKVLRTERLMDGLVILKTTSNSLSDIEVARGYRGLWRVEDAFRHIKGPIDLRPIRHWNDARVRGHILVCVMAYALERLMDQRLADRAMGVTARKAMAELETITVATMEACGQEVRRRSKITPRQQDLLRALGVRSVPEIW